MNVGPRGADRVCCLAVVAVLSGCLLPSAPPDIDPTLCAERAPPSGGVLIAGSGANIPIVRALLREVRSVDEPHRVAESIGSSGAVAALADGAIDIGLLSRALRPDEEGSGLRVVPFASSPVVWAVHPSVPVTEVDADFLADVYAGRGRTWPDGTPVVPIVREPGDSGLEVLAATYPEIVAASEGAWRAGRGVQATSDTRARVLLEQVPGAVGPSDVGLLRVNNSPARPVRVGGRDPLSLPQRTLSVTFAAARADELAPLLDPLIGPGAGPILARYGYGPAR